MGRIRKKLLLNKKGQLFLLEVFIALSVLILLMIALFQVEFTATPTYQENLSEIGYDALESLNQAGELKPLVYNLLTSDLADSIDDILPINILWRLTVEDDVGTTIFSIYWDRTPPLDASVGATDYFLYGYEINLNQFRVIHLELWRLLG
ncbi:MAG: hypothetical protein FK730_15565 [Asgard group archaeon]|nr:hypothetical protein [Asgard group archaeon]